MIAIIDYGMGNLHSVSKAVERLGYEAVVTADAAGNSGSGRSDSCRVSALLAMRWSICENGAG